LIGPELARAGDGVIAFSATNVETFSPNAHFDRVVVLAAVVAARIVAERVLVASLLRYSGIESFERIALCGVENVATGIVRV
jgi:hypothetical protein